MDLNEELEALMTGPADDARVEARVARLRAQLEAGDHLVVALPWTLVYYGLGIWLGAAIFGGRRGR